MTTPTPGHRTEWAVLSDDGQVYEVDGKDRDTAIREARLLLDGADGTEAHEGEPGAKVVERRICDWPATLLHAPDAIPATPTPGTPATTEPVAYLDRDGDMWIPSGAPEVLLRLDTDCWVSRDGLTDVVRFYGPLVPLVREDVVAARVAAAREEGRAEVRDAAHLVAQSHAEQIRQLRAEVTAAEQRLAAVLELHSCRPCNDACLRCQDCGDEWPCATARAAAAAVPDTTHEGDPS